MIRKLFSHTAIYGLAPQITRVASILALPIITKDLTSIDFGVYGLITSIVGAVTVLNTLGLRIILTNSFYKSPYQYKWGWRQIYGFLMLWNIPYTILLASVIYLFIPPEAIDNWIPIVLSNVLPVVFFGPTAAIGTTFYQLRQKPLQIAWRSVIFGILTVVLNIYFISILKQGYMGWFLSTGIATMLSQVSYYFPINHRYHLRPIFNFKWRYIKYALKVSIPTIPHYYSTYLLDSSDRLIMKSVGVVTSQIGVYNAAYTVANFVRQGGMAAGFAIGPMLNAAFKEGREDKARDLIFVLKIVFLAGTFLLSIWLKEIFYILIKNEELQSSYKIGIVLVMAYCYRPMYLAANSKLFYVEKTTLLLRVTFVAAVLNVVLNFIFIPIWGIQAAAWVTYLSLMYMGYAGFFIKSVKEINNVNYHPIVFLIINFILCAMAILIVTQTIEFKLAASLIVVCISSFIINRIIKNITTKRETS